MFTVHKALPLMTRGGSIILNASIVADKGLPAHGAYGATKAALRSLAKTWTIELKDRGIRVNTLSPGATDTPIIDGQFTSKAQADAAKATFGSMTPLGRLGRPEEQAAAALFLASDSSSFITGIDLPVDGGLGRPIADAKLEALRHFAAVVTRNRGVVSPAEVAAFKKAGYDNRPSWTCWC